jgi:hypothetical protein
VTLPNSQPAPATDPGGAAPSAGMPPAPGGAPAPYQPAPGGAPVQPYVPAPAFGGTQPTPYAWPVPPATPPAQPQQPPAAQPGQPPVLGQPGVFDPNTLSPEAQAYLKTQVDAANFKARDVARQNAATQAQQDLMAKLSQALGLQQPTSDPAQLQQQLAQQSAQARTYQVQNQVLGAAYAAGADGQMMTAMLSYNGKLGTLDPAAPDFHQQVQTMVAAELAANPRLALQPTAPPPPLPAAQGATSNGMAAGGNTDRITAEQLSKMTPNEIADAMERGELKHLL